MAIDLSPADRQIVDRHFGTEDALNDADIVVTMLILAYIRRVPAMNRRMEVTLQAIASLSEHNATLARSLMTELEEATF